MTELTREVAWAAATDAGNRNMRKNGRQKWSEADHAAACAVLDRLWPAPIVDGQLGRSIRFALHNQGVSDMDIGKLAGDIP